MANYPGFSLGLSQQWTRDHLHIAPLDDFGGALYDERQSSLILTYKVDAFTNNAPVETIASTAQGVKSQSFFDDYYFRVHIRPTVIDVGNLISTQQRQFEVWNAHFDSRTLSAIHKYGAFAGLELSDAPLPPAAYGPLQSYVYTLTAKVAGDPVIDATFDFVFGSEHVSLRITGRRVVVWVIRPDWSHGITERLEWLTDVLTADDGTEQRVRLRRNARRTLEMAWLAQGQRAMIADTLLTGWGSRKYCVPVWMERDRAATPISAGSTTITVTSASLKDYMVGGYVVLWADETLTEAIEIAAIAGNTLTLKTPVANSYPAGASICPAMFGRIDGDVQVRHVRSDALAGIVRFLDEMAKDRQAAEIGPTWQGYAVLDERPDYSEDQESTWSRTLEVLDSLTGVMMVDDTTGYPVIRRTYTWVLNGRQAIDRWKKWAAARAGRLTALWLPSFMDDLDIVQDIQPSDTSITVRSGLNARYGVGMPNRAAIRIETAGGQVFHRRITSMAEASASTEQLVMDSSLGVLVPVSSIRRAMWVSLARLESDALEVHYETDSIARIQATFRIVTQ
jgi:hypothetical protein